MVLVFGGAAAGLGVLGLAGCWAHAWKGDFKLARHLETRAVLWFILAALLLK
jgi:hypothetical protein